MFSNYQLRPYYNYTNSSNSSLIFRNRFIMGNDSKFFSLNIYFGLSLFVYETNTTFLSNERRHLIITEYKVQFNDCNIY